MSTPLPEILSPLQVQYPKVFIQMLPVLGGIFESQGSFGFERDQNSPDATKN